MAAEESSTSGSTREEVTHLNVNRMFPLYLFLLFAPLYGWAPLYLPLGPIQFDHVGAFLLFGCGTMIALRTGSLQISRSDSFLLIFTMVVFISFSVSIISSFSILSTNGLIDMTQSLSQLIVVLSLVILVQNIPISLEDLLSAFRLWLFTSVIASVFGMYQATARLFSLPLERLYFNYNGEWIVQRIGYDYGAVFRVGSIFPEPAAFGIFLVPPTVLLTVNNIFVENHDTRPIIQDHRVRYFIICVLSVGIILSASLLAYLTVFVTVSVIIFPLYYYFTDRINNKFAVMFAIVVSSIYTISDTFRLLSSQFVLLPINAIIAIGSGNVFALPTIGSTSARLRNVVTVVSAWADGTTFQLLLGFGPNSLTRLESSSWNAATGWYFQLIIDYGILGTISFTLFLVLLAKKLINVAGEFTRLQGLAAGLVAAIFATGFIFFQAGAIRPARWISIYLGSAFLGIYSPTGKLIVLSPKAVYDQTRQQDSGSDCRASS